MHLEGGLFDHYPVESVTVDVVQTLNTLDRCNGLVVEEATIDQFQDYMSSGRLTSVQLTACYRNRIVEVDPYINSSTSKGYSFALPFPAFLANKILRYESDGTPRSVLQLNPGALKIAGKADAERAAGYVRGPLHGIPFLAKANIASKDRLQTAAGSLALAGSVVPRDAFVVASLREAGAVLMGKSTLSEWADMRSSNYPEGYSATGGQSRSSYNLTVNPGGRSSSSAVAVVNNVISFAIGTETDGNVINPAERNAMVGIKPNVGLTSRAGVVPESVHQDTVGTFARTVRDAVYALDAIYGRDDRDNYISAQAGKTPPEGYVAILSNKTALQGANLASHGKASGPSLTLNSGFILLELINLIESAGATVVNNTDITNHESLVSPDGWNWDYGGTRGRANESEYTYGKSWKNTTIRSLADVVQINDEHASLEGASPGLNPAFAPGQDGLLASLATGGEMNATYRDALPFCQTATRAGIDEALGDVDALLVPPARADITDSRPSRISYDYHPSKRAFKERHPVRAGIDGDSVCRSDFGQICKRDWRCPEEVRDEDTENEAAVVGVGRGEYPRRPSIFWVLKNTSSCDCIEHMFRRPRRL
ncbi:MAG: hypothetical protein L6R40_007768 [Gallowayella cf. fulva]|nr:MAG: hypothetical protein L6R40_007768 [Xanthomendoza cf. fulva]